MTQGKEKRRSYRMAMPDTEALCCFEGDPAPHRVVDISLGGVKLDAGEPEDIGTPAFVAIFMRGRGTVRVAARVVHVDPDHHTMGLVFEDLPAHGEDLIHDWVTDALLARRFWGDAALI